MFKKPKINTNLKPDYNWFHFQQKNKPQSNAVSAGILLFLSGGYHIGWGIFNPHIKNETWAQSETNFFINLTINMFYIGTIIGIMLSVALHKKLSKKFIYCIASTIIVVINILLIFFPTSGTTIMGVRLCSGIANGFILPTVISHAGEVAIKEIRGMLTGSMAYCLYIGMFTMVIIIMPFTIDMDEYTIEISTMVGIMALMIGIIALIVGQLLYVESPLYLISEHRDDDALKAMMTLRTDNCVTPDIQADYVDMKTMVNEDNILSPSIFGDGNSRPLIAVGLTIVLHVLSVNLPINLIRLTSILDQEIGNLVVVLASALIIRTLLGIINFVMIDKMGRKKIILFSGSLTGITLIIYGICLNASDDLGFYVRIGFFLAYEVFLAIGINSIPYVLMAEAFPVTKKFNSIVAGIILESILHVILIAITMELELTLSMSSVFLFGFGGIMVVISIYLHINLPETMKLTLREARDAFRK